MTTLRLIALLTLALALPARAGVTIHNWTAATGAKVLFVENHDLPILDVEIDFAAGSVHAPADKAGVAGLTHGLLDAGAGDLDEEQIAARQVDLGARIGGAVDDDRASLSLRSLSSATERDAALDLLHTLITRPTFPEDVLARERGRAIASIQEADTRPDHIADKRFTAAIYPGHPYGVSASVDSVGRVSRDDLVAYHRRFYTARHAVISIIGDVTRAQAEAIATRLSTGLPEDASDAVPPPVTLPKAEVIKLPHPAAQSHIQIGMPALRRGDPDFFALQVGNYTLGGGGFVSRLMNEVREKRGLVYDVHSYFAARKLEGPFQIGLQTRRDQADAALKVVNEVLADFLRTGPTAAELKAAKQNLSDGLALRIDSNAKLLGYLGVIGFYNLPLTWLDDYAAKVNAVTAEQVKQAFARHVKPENLVTVVVAGD